MPQIGLNRNRCWGLNFVATVQREFNPLPLHFGHFILPRVAPGSFPVLERRIFQGLRTIRESDQIVATWRLRHGAVGPDQLSGVPIPLDGEHGFCRSRVRTIAAS